MMARLRRYFIAGLLVWVPLWITVLAIDFLVDLLDKSLSLLPAEYQPEALFGVNIPGLGVLFVLAVLLVTGILVTNFLGHRLVRLWEAIVGRIPLVRTIYLGVKQVLHTILSPGGQSFRKVLLVQYPRQGLWSIAFQTGAGNVECCEKSGKTLITIFVPTTPNPTSGFLIMVPEEDAVELDMSIDAALKMVISLGVVQPEVKGVEEKPQSTHTFY